MRILSVAIVLTLAVAVRALADETVERRGPADPRGEVQITDRAGEVQVVGWDRPEIEIEGELGESVERLNFETRGNRTVIEVVLPGGRHSSSESELTVRIPRDSTLTVVTVSADQTISDVRGPQRLQAVSGSIITESWSELEAKTISGDLTVQGRGGGSVR